MTRPPKDDLLAHYATKPVQRFLQVDGFTGCQGDTVLAGDTRHGDRLMIRVTCELMSTPGRHLPLRVLIHEDADPEDVRRLLTAALDDLDGSFAFFRGQSERELFARAGIKQTIPIPGIDDGNGERPF